MCSSSAERCGAGWSTNSSAYARLNSAWKAMNTSSFGWLGYTQHNVIDKTWLQNTILNPKYTVNPNNYCSYNYIPVKLMANSVIVDGEFLLEWYE